MKGYTPLAEQPLWFRRQIENIANLRRINSATAYQWFQDYGAECRKARRKFEFFAFEAWTQDRAGGRRS